SHRTTMATSGRCGPTSSGSRDATTSRTVPHSSRWRRWSSIRSHRPLRPSNKVHRLGVWVSCADAPLQRGEVSSMKTEKFDVVILGGGNAGIGVTGPVRRAGLSVAMIESGDLGGTCPNRGCTPKKILVAAGHALHEIDRASVHHIAVGRPKLDWAALIEREKDMIKDIPQNLARAMAKRGVDVIAGQAAFVGPNTIRVGERLLDARYIVIAT